MRVLQIILAACCVFMTTPAQAARVQIVSPPQLNGLARYGWEKLAEQISSMGHAVERFDKAELATGSNVILAGLASDKHLAGLIQQGNQALPKKAEALTIRHIQEDGTAVKPQIWQREFVRRFGEEARRRGGEEARRRGGEEAGPLVMRAMHKASGVLPRIVAASYPANHAWATCHHPKPCSYHYAICI